MSDKSFMLEVITPEEILVRDKTTFSIVPAVNGELGILRNHAPLVAALKIGVLRYKDENDKEKRIAISGGFIEVIDNTVRVLAETAEQGIGIDVLRAKAAKERAQKRLQQQDENANFTRAQLALQRAIARLKATGETD